MRPAAAPRVFYRLYGPTVFTDRGAMPYRSPLLRRVDCGCPERAVGDSAQRAAGGQALGRRSGLFSEHRGSEPARSGSRRETDARTRELVADRVEGPERGRPSFSPMPGKRPGKRPRKKAGLDLRESADHPHPHLLHGGGSDGRCPAVDGGRRKPIPHSLAAGG